MEVRMVRFTVLLLFALSVVPLAAAQDGHVLRIQADHSRGRIWVLALDALYLQERSGPALRRFPLPGWMHLTRAQAGLPDLIVDSDGTAIASSNVVPHLWRVDPERASVDLLEIDLGADERRDMGFTSLSIVNPGVIRARSSMDQGSWRIDLGARRAWPMHPATSSSPASR
jgi:hypothetical protein